MDDKTAQQILQSLSKLDDKITAVQSDVASLKLQVATSTTKTDAEIKAHAEQIQSLFRYHKECENTKCEKYAKITELEKKIGGVEWFLKLVSFIGSAIVIGVALFRAIKGV